MEKAWWRKLKCGLQKDGFYLTAYKGVVGFHKKCGYIEDERLTDDGDLPTLKKEVVIDNKN